MKQKDLISDEELEKRTEEECGICEVHNIAYDKTPNYWFECPYCKAHIEMWELDSMEVETISEVNYTESEQSIVKGPVDECPECEKRFVLLPCKVRYNGNHDIYYTGGKKYLMDNIKLNEEEYVKKIENFIERIGKGERLEAWNLFTWLSYQLEEDVAAYLFKRGYKK